MIDVVESIFKHFSVKIFFFYGNPKIGMNLYLYMRHKKQNNNYKLAM